VPNPACAMSTLTVVSTLLMAPPAHLVGTISLRESCLRVFHLAKDHPQESLNKTERRYQICVTEVRGANRVHIPMLIVFRGWLRQLKLLRTSGMSIEFSHCL